MDRAPVDTRSTTDRRPVRFATIAEALADAERCAAADEAGTLRRSGNWTPGQIFGHLAWWIDGAFDGYPASPPWFVRLLGPLLKNSALRRVQFGVRLPGVPGGTYGTEPMPTREGLERLRRAFERLERGAPERPNPVFGKMTHEEWKQLHLRHAEGHLAFLHPNGADER